MVAKAGASSDPAIVPHPSTPLPAWNPAHYQSDIYTNIAAGYYPLMVWQFWGRAARRPELKSLGRFLFASEGAWAFLPHRPFRRQTYASCNLRPQITPRI